MLQQNNNNNYLCLDMAHRELLQGCGRSSAPLGFGALGFGAIPLIKGLRAWAVSGGFSNRGRRKPAGENQDHQPLHGQRAWKTKENLASLRTPGALVTVATLKGSEGVRQTQTRCLFLKAEGCSYLCTLGNSRVAGPRVAGQRTHLNPAEGTGGEAYGSGRGRRVCRGDTATCEVKPQVIRKWRKSGKAVRSTRRSSVSESKGDVVSSKLEQGQGAKRDSFTTRVDATLDCAITPCLRAKHKHGTVNKNTEKVYEDKTDLYRCEPDTFDKVSSTEVHAGQEVPRPGGTDEATAGVQHKNDLVADVNPAKSIGTHFISDVPKSKESSLESELMQVNSNRNQSAEVKQNFGFSDEETRIANVVNASRNSSDDTLQQGSKPRIGKELPKRGSESGVPSEEMEKDLSKAGVKTPKEDASHDDDLAGEVSGPQATVDKGFCKNRINQAEMLIHSEEKKKDEDKPLNMAGTRSTLDYEQGHGPEGMEKASQGRIDKDSLQCKPEMVIRCEEMEIYKDLGMPSTKSPVENPGQNHDLTGVESGSREKMGKDSINSENGPSDVSIHSLQMEKNEDEALGKASIKNPVEDPGQDHGPEEMQSGSSIDKDSITRPGKDIHSEEMEKEALGMKSTKSLDSGQGHDPARVESENSQRYHSLQKEDDPLDITRSQGEDPAPGHDLVGVENGSRVRKDKDTLASKKGVIHSEEMDRDEALDSANTRGPEENPGDGRVERLKESCLPQRMKEVKNVCEEEWRAKSRSQGSPKASSAVATALTVPNPASTSTSISTTAIATAPVALDRQEEVGAGFRGLRPQPHSQLLSEQEEGQDWSKVATNDRPVDVGEEEEDEFGVFMQAGEEQIWTEEFSKLQQVPSGTHNGIGCRNCADATEAMSWTSDWTGLQSFHQSDDTWATFKQEDDSRVAESEITPSGQWWNPTAVENTNLTLSPLHSVTSVFLEAFPSVDSSSGDADCVPTLKELLQRPAENNSASKPQNQSLLDGLQDLDRMIDVKYKRAEFLSRKLLLQSLHLDAVATERVSVRKSAAARFSPNLPTSHQQLAANAKRRLSYDINRNIMA